MCASHEFQEEMRFFFFLNRVFSIITTNDGDFQLMELKKN